MDDSLLIVNYLPCCYLNVDWKNETNTEMRLDVNESSIFVSILWMAGIICSPLGGILSCWLGQRLLNRWTSQLDLGCTTG